MFIVFEGGDGCGKTTQSQKLYEYFLAQGKNVILTREPGGTPQAEILRNLLVLKDYDWPLMAELLLMIAARVDHYEKLIKPHLDQGGVVICDRFVLSTLVYQGYGRGMDLDKIKRIHDEALGFIKVDKTFVLLLPFQEGGKRAQVKQKFETLDTSFQKRVYEGYKELGKAFDMIDVEGKSIDEIYQEILRYV